MVSRRERGFTLVELLIVVVILAVLAVVAVFAYKRYVRNARVQEAISVLGDIKIKQAQFFASYGRYISTVNSDSEWDEDAGYWPATIPPEGGLEQDWNVDCTTAAAGTAEGEFCILGVRPATAVYFQYKTVGWNSDEATLAGDPPAGTIPTAAWQNAGEPRWWYASARTHWTRDTRPQAWVAVLISVILKEPIAKHAYEVDFAQ